MKKNIYVSHSSNFDYDNELYAPLQNSKIGLKYKIILPHYGFFTPVAAKDYIEHCNILVADVSIPSIGLGIELGWASMLNKKIICTYKTGSKISTSIEFISKIIIEYSDSKDLIKKLEDEILKV